MHLQQVVQAPANTVQYVQAQFVTNYYGSGASNDLLEVQMMDTYPDQPMYIAVQLASQAVPTGGFALFERTSGSGSIRAFKLASGQNLKNKAFRIYISTASTGTNLRTLDFTTTSASSSGFVTLT